MTVLTTAILDEEKKAKPEDEQVDSATVPVVATKVPPKGATIAVVNNRRNLSRRPHRIFLFVITLIGLLCALGGLCYGIYYFAKLGHANRHRIFCRVIEASPIRRTRIITEKADLSTDGHALRLFTPSFLYEKRVYSSSVVMIIDEHDITVIKVESRRQCFVKQPTSLSRRSRSHEPWALFHWFRHVEEGRYFPNLQLLRRKWMARTPHISHIEAGRIYHPKVAEFCKEMRVFRMVEVHERIGVIPFGGGLLPKCPLRKCSLHCPGGRYELDNQGCRTCQCNRRSRCRPICAMYCPYGNVKDRSGCPICQCNKSNRRIIVKRSVGEARSNLSEEQGKICRIFYVTSGVVEVDPLLKKRNFEVDDIKICSST